MRFRELGAWAAPAKSLVRAIPDGWRRLRIGDSVNQISRRVATEPERAYAMMGVKWYGEGVFLRETVLGKDLSASHVYPLAPGAFVYNRLFAWKGSFAVVPSDIGEQYVSNEFPQFIVDQETVLPQYLYLYAMSKPVSEAVNRASSGSAAVSRNRLKEPDFLAIEIPLPPLATQQAIVDRWRDARDRAEGLDQAAVKQEAAIAGLIYECLGASAPTAANSKGRLLASNWRNLERWSVNYLNRARSGLLGFTHSRFPIEPLKLHFEGTANGLSIKPTAGRETGKVLKLNALQPAGLDMTAVKGADIPAAAFARFSLKKGDLLICRSVGSYDMVAKCALVEQDAPDTIYPDIMIRARLGDTLLPEYVREVMQTPLGRAYFQSNARTAVGMWKIGATDIQEFPIPVPPLPIQESLVSAVSAIRARARALREEAEALKTRAAAETEAAILGQSPPCLSGISERTQP